MECTSLTSGTEYRLLCGAHNERTGRRWSAYGAKGAHVSVAEAERAVGDASALRPGWFEYHRGAHPFLLVRVS